MQIDAPKPAFWPKRIGLRDNEVERFGRCVGVTANAREGCWAQRRKVMKAMPESVPLRNEPGNVLQVHDILCDTVDEVTPGVAESAQANPLR